MKIFDRITNSYTKETPFVVYRKPNRTTISGLFMNDNSLFYTDKFTESGFVFAPFNNKEKSILFHFLFNLVPITYLFLALQFPDNKKNKFENNKFKFQWEQISIINNIKSKTEFSVNYLEGENIEIGKVINLLQINDQFKVSQMMPFAKYNLKIKLKDSTESIMNNYELLKVLEAQKIILIRN